MYCPISPLIYIYICTQKNNIMILLSIYFITFEKIISKQSMFVSDRTTNMPNIKMKNEIYGSLVTIHYHAKCKNPLYRKFTGNKFCFYIFAANLTWSLLIFKFKTQTNNHTHLSVIAPYNAATSSKKIAPIWHTRANMRTDWQQTLTATTKMNLEPVIMESKR